MPVHSGTLDVLLALPTDADLVDQVPPAVVRGLIATAQELGYDVIVFDAPELGNVSDALSIATEVDDVFVVVWRGRTLKSAHGLARPHLRRSRHHAPRIHHHGCQEPDGARGRRPVKPRASSSVGREAVLILVAKAGSALATVVLAIVLANALGPASFGRYRLALTAAGIAAILAAQGLAASTGRYLDRGARRPSPCGRRSCGRACEGGPRHPPGGRAGRPGRPHRPSAR